MTLRAGLAILAALPATLLGAAAAARAGVPWTAFAPNLVAIALGLLTVPLLVEARRRLSAWLPWGAVALVALTLVAPGLDGVHRWLPLGPLSLNASLVALPWVFVGALDPSRPRRSSLAATLTLAALHLAQPDAGQATVLASLSGLLLVGRGRQATATAATTAALAIATWLRADPVAPVPHVEGVVALVASGGSLWNALLALVALVTLAAAALVRRPDPPTGPGELRIAMLAPIWLVASVVVTAVGAYPVPFLGAGAAPILGWSACVALVAARRPKTPSATGHC